MTGQPSSTRVPVCPTPDCRGVMMLCQTADGKGYYLLCFACQYETKTVTNQNEIGGLVEWRSLNERSNA